MHTKESTLTYNSHVLRDRLVYQNAAEHRRCDEETVCYIARFVDIGCQTTEIIATSAVIDIQAINGRAIRSIVNLKRMNDIENANEFLARVNRKLPYGGLYIGCVETLEQRKKRILRRFVKVISYPAYFFDFIIKRVFSKSRPTGIIYNLLTRGNNRAMSLTETLGRLRICGFSIEEYAQVGGLTYFVVRKIAEPLLETEVRYGIIIRLRRIGKGGKWFNVYKFRTMHPYAEFLQDYLYKKYKLKNGDKISNDFRITSWGRILRKVWLDEQPMWINWLRGDVKLIGVRPLSQQKLSLYPREFRKRRINYKPGLIPPFYVDLPESIDELVGSEKKYLDAYDQHPRWTDLRYFFMAMYNIVIKRARSE